MIDTIIFLTRDYKCFDFIETNCNFSAIKNKVPPPAKLIINQRGTLQKLSCYQHTKKCVILLPQYSHTFTRAGHMCVCTLNASMY